MAAGFAFKRNQHTQNDDWFYRRCAGWKLKFVWWPDTCNLTGRRLWLELAYRGTSLLTGPGDTIVYHRWHDKNEHLIFKIKGN
jgi:hypothetical protein